MSDLPPIPYAPDFRAFADIGKRLAEIHVNYEQQTDYGLERIEKRGAGLDWRVEKMKLSKGLSNYMEAHSGFTVDTRGITENESANRILWKDLTNFGITEETRGPTIKIPIRLVHIDSTKQSFRTRYGLLSNAHVLLALCDEMSTPNT